LIETHRLRIFAKPLGVLKIDASEQAVVISFGRESRVDPAKVIKLIQTDSRYRLISNEKLRFEINIPEMARRARTIRETLAGIALPMPETSTA
jgi:transcription-repair coupling factor (superfamily II helicase)